MAVSFIGGGNWGTQRKPQVTLSMVKKNSESQTIAMSPVLT
jgi:hypothetical protein